MRFGRWQEIIDEPLPDDPRAVSGLDRDAALCQGRRPRHAEAIRRRRARARAVSRSLERIPSDRKVFNNSARSILAVGEKMLDGELEYHRGNHERGLCPSARGRVDRDDNLEYIEPWAWMHPPRHALAALLAEQGHYGEAEQVYRDDLGLSGRIQRCAQHPDNVWALHGLVECLQQRGEVEELAGVQASSQPRWRWRMCRSRRRACAGPASRRPIAAAKPHRYSPDRAERDPAACFTGRISIAPRAIRLRQCVRH